MTPSERVAFLLRWRESIVAEGDTLGFRTKQTDLDCIDFELALLLATELQEGRRSAITQ